MNRTKINVSKRLIPRHLYIYWCYTRFHDRDWFVYAASPADAKDIYFSYTEYPPEDTIARQVCKIPKSIQLEESNLAEPELLKELGFEFLYESDPCIIRYNGIIFTEGNGDNILFFDERHRVQSAYLMQILDTNHYKIGYSKDVHIRRKQLSSNAPFYVTILGVIKNPAAKIIERELLTCFKRFASSREWLTFDDWGASLLKTAFNLYFSEFSGREENHVPSNTFEETKARLIKLINNHRYKQPPSNQDILELQAIREIMKVDALEELKRLKVISSWFISGQNQ
jgi:hypothetical protein